MGRCPQYSYRWLAHIRTLRGTTRRSTTTARRPRSSNSSATLIRWVPPSLFLSRFSILLFTPSYHFPFSPLASCFFSPVFCVLSPFLALYLSLPPLPLLLYVFSLPFFPSTTALFYPLHSLVSLSHKPLPKEFCISCQLLHINCELMIYMTLVLLFRQPKRC